MADTRRPLGSTTLWTPDALSRRGFLGLGGALGLGLGLAACGGGGGGAASRATGDGGAGAALRGGPTATVRAGTRVPVVPGVIGARPGAPASGARRALDARRPGRTATGSSRSSTASWRTRCATRPGAA